MKKQLLLLAMILLPMAASADAVWINGIWYNLDSSAKTAEVTSNPDNQFKYTGDVVIPESVSYENVNYSVTSIGWGAFFGSSSLTSISIPNSVSGIGSEAFAFCEGLTSVKIFDVAAWCIINFANSASNPLRYAQHLFINGEEVKDLIIPNGVTSIGDYAFSGCLGLTSVTIPNSTMSIGASAFNNCLGLTSVHISDLEAWCKISFPAYNSNPLFYAHHLYLNGEEIKDLVIPNSITNIGNYAFRECSALTSISIPNGVESIGDQAFYNCSALTSVTIPNSMTSIGGGAFGNCSELTSVTIPNSVTSIGVGAFQGCSGLTSVTMSDNVTSIESCAFWGCSGLTTFTIPNSATYIGAGAFSGCSSLTSINIPNGVTSIGIQAFYECSSLSLVTIPNSVTIIEEGAFYECSALTSVTIPNSVTSIGDHAFYGCEGLTSVSIPNSVTSMEDLVFYGCYGLTSVTIPNSVTSIGVGAFAYCGLTSVTIPNGVTSIREHAFEKCFHLTSVSIGSGIKDISDSAFASCLQLKDVYCHAISVPNTGTEAFKNSPQGKATLHVPAESVDAYKATEPWKNFGSFEGIDGPDKPKCATPSIAMKDGKLHFECETEGVKFIYDIQASGNASGEGNDLDITPSYVVKVYATKDGYEDSDVATETINIIKGDVDGDGMVDIADAVHIVNYVVGKISALAPRFEWNIPEPE